jgi:hypothetical protein
LKAEGAYQPGVQKKGTKNKIQYKNQLKQLSIFALQLA